MRLRSSRSVLRLTAFALFNNNNKHPLARASNKVSMTMQKEKVAVHRGRRNDKVYYRLSHVVVT